MKKLLFLSAIILLEILSIFSIYTNSLISQASAQECVDPGESCYNGSGGDLKTCCSQGGRRFTCEPDGPATIQGQNHICKPDASDPNNDENPDNQQSGACVKDAGKGPCSNNKDCCSTNDKQLVCYPERNGGKGLCDVPNKDNQNCVNETDAKCEGNGGAQDCCRKTNDKHEDFECVDKDKKPTNDSGTCKYVDINTGPKCLAKGVSCKTGDWKCCGEMTCHREPGQKEGKCREGLQEPPSPPCAEGSFKDGKCGAVPTALGKISTDPEGFIQSLFAILLSLSGGIALLLIMKSGYLIMTAQGKPEAIQSGRDQLIAAIVGLIFLIFSFVLLQVIGFEILKIPENAIPKTK